MSNQAQIRQLTKIDYWCRCRGQGRLNCGSPHLHPSHDRGRWKVRKKNPTKQSSQLNWMFGQSVRVNDGSGICKSRKRKRALMSTYNPKKMAEMTAEMTDRWPSSRAECSVSSATDPSYQSDLRMPQVEIKRAAELATRLSSRGGEGEERAEGGGRRAEGGGEWLRRKAISLIFFAAVVVVVFRLWWREECCRQMELLLPRSTFLTSVPNDWEGNAALTNRY